MNRCTNCGSPLKKDEEMYADGKVYCPRCWASLITGMKTPIRRGGNE